MKLTSRNRRSSYLLVWSEHQTEALTSFQGIVVFCICWGPTTDLRGWRRKWAALTNDLRPLWHTPCWKNPVINQLHHLRGIQRWHWQHSVLFVICRWCFRCSWIQAAPPEITGRGRGRGRPPPSTEVLRVCHRGQWFLVCHYQPYCVSEDDTAVRNAHQVK